MAANKSWALTSNIRLQLKVEDKTFDVIQFSGDWALNAIPQAQVMVAIGRDGANPSKLATVHTAKGLFKHMKKAQVTIKLEGEYSPKGGKWPEGEMVLFDGYATGLAFTKQAGQLVAAISMQHWLVDLSFSSTMSATSHPASAGDFAYAAAGVGMTAGAGGQGGQVGGGTQIDNLPGDAAFLSMGNALQDDLWGAIKDYLCKLAGQDFFTAEKSECLGEAIGSNARAVEALKRIEGGGGDCEMAYKYAKAAGFGAGSGQEVAEAASIEIGAETISSFAGSTFWDKIVGGYCSKFQMCVVPMVNRALVVPLQLGLRTVWRTIKPDEYMLVNEQSALTRPLRAVAIYMPTQAFANNAGVTATNVANPALVPPGCFRPTDMPDSEAGMVLVQYAPGWLGNIPITGDHGGYASGITERKPTGTATTPQEANSSPLSPPDVTIPGTLDLANRLAHAIYVGEALRGRTAAFQGRLRFDLSPGSVVQLDGSPEQLTGAEDALASTLIGTISRVSISISAETPEASTRFEVVSHRDEEENKLDAMSIAVHPLFTYAFSGAPLIEGHESLK